ncbi:hypothetical protein [Streptomyces sp. UNOB3_S3]|uniref:hypothetical protein n=1 Tax=Streptomyces sp. UNOB3_S3 TaxID=2871682 RepID=UPI001E6573D1|nr:hypothetical protein [Streptomyces sp. UNOB3_S3]MCC3779522.1 hypothetical protein [Streptomyces sp. UNOB3_S3]
MVNYPAERYEFTATTARVAREFVTASGVTLVWDDLHVVGKQVWFELRESSHA